MDITKLKGVGEATAKKLAKGGIDEVEQLMIYPPPKVAEMLGVDDYIRKPFAMDKLVDSIEKLLAG